MARVDKRTQIVKMDNVAKRRKWPKSEQIGQNGKNAQILQNGQNG